VAAALIRRTTSSLANAESVIFGCRLRVLGIYEFNDIKSGLSFRRARRAQPAVESSTEQSEAILGTGCTTIPRYIWFGKD